MKRTNRTAIWAINPFEPETRPHATVLEELRVWAAATQTQLRPVHVLYVPTAEVPVSEARGSWVARYIPVIERHVRQFLSGMQLPPLQPPKVLAQHGGSTQEAVRALIDYAEDEGASWILVSSRGKSGLKRLMLGSFAESLLLASPIPVWVFGHGDPVTLDPALILFSTDFSDVSKSAFDLVVDQARELDARITLFHCVNLPQGMLSNLGTMGMTPYIPPDEYLNDQLAWAKRTAASWAAEAWSRGVKVEFVFKELVSSVAQAILSEATREDAGVIAMASRSGSLASTLLGSSARQVIRVAHRPVWLFGPKWSGTALKHAA